MSKLFYLFLVWVVSICILVKCIEGQNSSFKLKYTIRDVQSGEIESKKVDGKKQKDESTKIGDDILKKPLFLFKLPIRNYINYFKFRRNTELTFLHNDQNIARIQIPNASSRKLDLVDFSDNIGCNVQFCKIGVFFYKDPSIQNPIPENFSNIDNIFYVVFEATQKYKYLIFAKLRKYYGKKELDIVPCPHETWISNHSLSKYIVDKNDIIPFPEKNESDKYYYYYKIMPYQNSSSEIFLKCGQIKQKYVPPIDVGYACCFADNETVLTYLGHDQFHFNNMNLNIDSYNGLLHNELGNLLNSSFISLLILLPENNFNSTSAVIGRYNNDSKLYSGQTVFVLPLKWYEESNYKVSAFPSGYPFHYNSQFLVPNIETTLRLKANDKVQRFKTTNSSEGTDIYTIDLREMNNGHVGCHAVPDNITHPGFKDFYEKRYKTNLLMFDEKTDKYLEVYDIKSLVSNSKYKCVINVDTITSDNKKPKFIKETNFTISFSNESSFTTWIIIGVSVSIISLLVIGLIIYKKLKPRKIESDNTPSIGISTPTSTSKSSTVTTSVVNAPIIQNKKVAPLSNTIGKKIVTKNSNINANNQMKKVTNKTEAKKSNVKQICEDSVFQMK